MTSLPPPNYGALSSKFGSDEADTALSDGVSSGYPILRIKGKVWTITRGGAEPHVLMRPDGDGPRNSVDLVIVQASQHISKVFYESYEEGAARPPDCSSHNGIVPHPSSPKKQHSNCAACPQNQFGSRITVAGKKGKACRDSKRAAVSPLGDIRNEAFGGPMLLRIPADSLKEFSNYGKTMRSMGFPYYGVGTKVAFDPNEAYPKLVLSPLPPLNDEQADAVMALRNSFQVKDILSEGSETPQQFQVEHVVKPVLAAPVTPQVTPPTKPEPKIAPKVEKPVTIKEEPVDKPVEKPAAKAAPVSALSQQTKPKAGDTFEANLDTALDNLLSDAS